MNDTALPRVVVADDDVIVHGRIEEQFRGFAGSGVFERVYCSTCDHALRELNGTVKVAILDNIFREGEDDVSHIHQLLRATDEASPGAAIVVLTEADLDLIDDEDELGPATILRKQGLRLMRKRDFFSDPTALRHVLHDALREAGSEIAVADLIRPKSKSQLVLVLTGFLKRIEGRWAEAVVRQEPTGEPRKLAIAARYFNEIGLTARNSRFRYLLEWEDGKLSGRVESLPETNEPLSPDLKAKLDELLEFDWGED